MRVTARARECIALPPRVAFGSWKVPLPFSVGARKRSSTVTDAFHNMPAWLIRSNFVCLGAKEHTIARIDC